MTPGAPKRTRAAILLSTESFEAFFGDGFGLTPERYARDYRNDWAWDWCAMLLAEGVRPWIYVASTGADGSRETGDAARVRFLRLGRLYEPWARFSTLSRSPPGRYLAQFVNAQALLPRLRAALVEDEIDVLLVQEYWTGRWDRLALALDVPLLAVDQGRPARREIKTLKRLTLPRARKVITQTEAGAALVRRYGARAERIPNGVDTTFFAPGERPADEHTVLIVARLNDHQKRISDLVTAMRHMGPPWRLLVAGVGPDGAALKVQAEALGVADRVEWLGFVPDRNRLRELYRRCAVFALPSAFEGLPMALLEAMSCGAACVGSDIAAIAEVLEDGRGGLLVPVGSPERLADAIVAAGVARDTLGVAARQAVLAEYSTASSGSRLAAVVRSAAD